MTRRPDQPTLTYPTTTIEPCRVPSLTTPPPVGDPGPPQRMQRIAGIDFSLTATGIAIITRRVNSTCIINTLTLKSKPTPAPTLADRYNRINTIAHDTYTATAAPDLVVIESLSFGSKGQLDRLWAGWWIVIGLYVKAGIPIATISPGSLKLALTGKGTADKAVMGGHIKKLWPELEYGNDNEVDAAALAHLGAVRLGWSVPTLERHKQAKSEWPTFGLGTALGLTGSDDLGATA